MALGGNRTRNSKQPTPLLGNSRCSPGREADAASLDVRPRACTPGPGLSVPAEACAKVTGSTAIPPMMGLPLPGEATAAAGRSAGRPLLCGFAAKGDDVDATSALNPADSGPSEGSAVCALLGGGVLAAAAGIAGPPGRGTGTGEGRVGEGGPLKLTQDTSPGCAWLPCCMLWLPGETVPPGAGLRLGSAAGTLAWGDPNDAQPPSSSCCCCCSGVDWDCQKSPLARDAAEPAAGGVAATGAACAEPSGVRPPAEVGTSRSCEMRPALLGSGGEAVPAEGGEAGCVGSAGRGLDRSGGASCSSRRTTCSVPGPRPSKRFTCRPGTRQLAAVS